MKNPDRRNFLMQTGSVLLATGAGTMIAHAARAITPSATAGPFYPPKYPLDSDADLVTVAGQDRDASGDIAHLFGAVYDSAGTPVKDVVVEIWQCDAFGFYHHPRDRGDQADARFQGFGKDTVNQNGEFHFRTIKPVSYPGRTPHIHFLVRSNHTLHLVSQLYVKNEPRNQSDGLYLAIPEERRASVTTEFVEAQARHSWISEPGALAAKFDIVLGV